MTRNASIVLVCIALYVLLPLRCSEAGPTKKPIANKSILADLMDNNATCSIKKIFTNSTYVRICNSLEFPTSKVVADDSNWDRFLCLGVYDRTATLCQLDSKITVGATSVVPADSKAFDDIVKTLIPTTEDEILDFCQKLRFAVENAYPPYDKRIDDYVVQLNKALEHTLKCAKLCTDAADKFNPVCAVLAAMENLVATTSKAIEITHEQTVPEVHAVDEIGKLPPSTGVSAEAAVKIPSEPKELPPKLQNPKAKQSSADEVETNDDVGKKDSPRIQSQQPKAAPAAPVLEIQKPKDDPPSPAKEKAQGEKGAKVVEPITMAHASQTEAAKSGDAKKAESGDAKTAESKPAVPEIPAAVPDTANTSMEEGSDVDGDNENGAAVPESPNFEEISEHTQDHEDPDGGDGNGEIEPPLIPSDDIDESPAMPSEKQQEFHPHIPELRTDDGSHFFSYFTLIGVVCITGYVGYHHKQKIVAMLVEGRRSRGGRGRRRPSTANYRKLDCTLEEAVTSQCNSNVTHVIY